ncbi:MAG: hypothetical protein QM532_03945 [Cyanobium sp. MAG06]|nr:hypothetical protein [Cyanobium sp. MAG06]
MECYVKRNNHTPNSQILDYSLTPLLTRVRTTNEYKDIHGFIPAFVEK